MGWVGRRVTLTDLEQQITGIFREVCGKRKQFLKVDGASMVSHTDPDKR